MGTGSSKASPSQQAVTENSVRPQTEESKCSNCREKNKQNHRERIWQPRDTQFPQTSRNARFSNNDVDERLDYKEVSQVNQTTKKFYFYPRKDKGQTSETFFVSSSKFPYSKPKAVTVRPTKTIEDKDPSHDPGAYMAAQPGFSGGCHYPKLETDVRGMTTMQREHPRAPPPPYVSDRRWSGGANILSREQSYPVENCVLPHKTVLKLRGSNQMQYGRHYNDFARDPQPRSHTGFPIDIEGRERPPTPGASDWYVPPHRTNDYLVASSLLAMEQQRERRTFQPEQRDIHDF